jgi:CubicO group peptidase (beta-lactamase class C family)
MRKLATLIAFSVSIGLLDTSPACAEAPTAQHRPPPANEAAAGFSHARLERLHAFMREVTKPGEYLGGVTLVYANGRVADWQAYGQRDLARREPMQRDDIFRIHSMTKTIATVAVLILVEEGKLALDDPVALHLPVLADLRVLEGGTLEAPKLRAPARPVTLRHLMTHTAGFAAGLPQDALAMSLLERADLGTSPDLATFVERLAKVPLAADPGTRFGYEAAPLEVLARVVEVVSGISFEAFLRARIFEPLDLRDTSFRVPVAKRDRVVDITTMGKDGKPVRATDLSARIPGERLKPYDSAAGGLYSTAGDYARFCEMLLGGGTLGETTILGRKTVELMFRNHLTMLEPPVSQWGPAEGFGLGGYVVIDAATRGVPGSDGQFGWSGAASTAYWIDPTERVFAILMLQHLPNGDPRDLPRVSRKVETLVKQALVP